MKKVLLKIDGMTCSACSSGLEKYLNKQDGIKQASVNLIMNNANIEYDDKKLTLEQIEKFVEKAGFSSLGIDNFEKKEKKKTNEKYKLISITIISILVLYISMSHMIGLPVIPFLNMMTYPINYAISLFVLTTIVLILGKDIIKNGYKNLIHKTPNMDTLVMIGVLASYIYSIYETIQILKGHIMHVESLYYESAAIVIFFIEIGRFVENKNKDKTKEALQQLMSITPNNAVIMRDGQTALVRTQLKRSILLIPITVGFFCSVVLIGLYFIGVVLQLDNIFSAQYFIPIFGILMGNMLSSNVIALNTYYSGLKREQQLYRYLLGNGATRQEAQAPFIRQAIIKSFSPLIANIAVMGLVAFPGTMIGQILGGSSPNVAIKYQMMIMVITFAASMLSLMITISLASRRSFDAYGKLLEVTKESKK